MHLEHVEMRPAHDISTMPYYGGHFKIVCEDPRLSLPYVGKSIRGLNMSKVKPTGLQAGDFECLLAICAASLNIEAVDPNNLGPAQKKIRNNYLYYNPTFNVARDAMKRLSVMTGHIARSVPAVNDEEER